MTGIKDYNKLAFFQAEEFLKQQDNTVLSPACLPQSDEITHNEYMVIDLAMLSM